MRARYPCIKVSVHEARSTKCISQCCRIEGCCFFAYPPSSDSFFHSFNLLKYNAYSIITSPWAGKILNSWDAILKFFTICTYQYTNRHNLPEDSKISFQIPTFPGYEIHKFSNSSHHTHHNNFNKHSTVFHPNKQTFTAFFSLFFFLISQTPWMQSANQMSYKEVGLLECLSCRVVRCNWTFAV